jgi:hypothetical protein
MTRHYRINTEGLDETDKSMIRNLRSSGALVEAKDNTPTLDEMREALRDMNADADEPRVGLILTDEDEGFQCIEDVDGNRARTNLKKSGWWYAVYL